MAIFGAQGFEWLWLFEEAAGNAAGPLSRLAALGWAYRQHSLEKPDYSRVMLGSTLPEFCASGETLKAAQRTFQASSTVGYPTRGYGARATLQGAVNLAGCLGDRGQREKRCEGSVPIVVAEFAIQEGGRS